MEVKFLLLETSGLNAQVGLGLGSRVLVQQALDIHHRHNRDLAPTVAALVRGAGWQPRDLQAVIVSRGPGSYTGLRVGIMSAKTLAYATGCRLIAVETFACLARQAPQDVSSLDVVADAQQGNVYTQSFERNERTRVWQTTSALSVEPVSAWLARRQPSTEVTGPGLIPLANKLGAFAKFVPSDCWLPKLETLLEAGIDQNSIVPAELLTLEPLYLRPSSAEQKWDSLGRSSLNAP
jgi:tRNA threonylcarbamoyladenosine biosynthesis protein TsaB